MAGEPSYIDYEAFLDPEFSPASFANSLVVATNNATDTPLDLSTPLSRVLFDLQEIDTHIHTLTTKSALPLLTHTRDQTDAASKILNQADEQIASVSQGYERLEREVLRKWKAAEEARVATENSLATVRLARAVARCIALGRQLEGQMAEVSGRSGVSGNADGALAPSSATGRDDSRALERAASTIVSLRRLLSDTGVGEEGFGLDRVKVTRALKSELLMPAENLVRARAQQAINRFSLSTTPASGAPSAQPSYKQARVARARLVSGVNVLYLLSPLPAKSAQAQQEGTDFQPELLLSTLQGYVQNTTVASLNNLSRALTMLPTLERTLPDVSARCQDLFALEAILNAVRPPSHPSLPQPSEPKLNILQHLHAALDTSSLPSYFWRSLASSLSGRVQEIIHRGGVSARTLRSNRDRLKTDIRDCVLRGSQLPPSAVGMEKRSATESQGNWEREAAVMVSSVVGVLER
ncbi:Golgi transport complex subunit 5-domain-containing protein [Aspergillus pseudodeflectus]|uniref:Conserved oligomeric Golgi complex subunit 5 n=1 Tax=Aspergillus pseudodeflectus TaxID=176178 RepID=A0ABR4L700_9EURO